MTKRAAFSIWNNRIAPVFDVARNMLIVDTTDGDYKNSTSYFFFSDKPQERALRLVALEVDQLICGAITNEMADELLQNGIQVISFVAGNYNKVVQAWLTGQLQEGQMKMPGCRRRKQQHGTNCSLHRNNQTTRIRREKSCQTEMDKDQ